MSGQLLQLDSAASSQTFSTSSSGVSSSVCSASSPSPYSADTNSGGSSYGDKDTEWRQTRAGGRRRRRAGRRRRSRSEGATARGAGGVGKKKVKNAREKERVRIVRQCYEKLSAVLGDRVERGSGHFSKVRTLTAAIRYIEELMKRRPRSEVASPSPPLRDVQVLQEANEPSPPSCSHYQSPPPQLQQCEEVKYDEIVISSGTSSPGLSLNCEERLEPATHDGSLDILQEDIPPTYSATPYFSYSSPGDFPPVIGNSSCMFPFPAVSSSPVLPLPPPPPSSSSSSSSLLGSPAELPSHYSLPSLPAGSTEYPLTMSPPFHCGPDVWLAIGCN